MNKLFKESGFMEHSIDSSQKFSRGGDDSFFIGFSFGSFLKVILSKVRATFLGTICHNPDYSSCMGITPFRYSELPVVSAGLFNHRIESAESDNVFPVGEFFDIFNFSHKTDGRFSPYTGDRSKDFYFSCKELIGYFVDKGSYGFSFFKQRGESGNFHLQQSLIEWVAVSNRVLCQLIDELWAHVRSSSFAVVRSLFYCVHKLFLRRGSDAGSRRELEKQAEHLFTKEGSSSLYLRENDTYYPFNLGFAFGNLGGYAFFLSDNRAKSLSLIVFFLRAFVQVFMFKCQVVTDGLRIFSISFSRFVAAKLKELEHAVRIYYFGIISPFSQEVKQIGVIDTGKFHADKQLLFKTLNYALQAFKSFTIHLKSFLLNHTVTVLNRHRKRMFSNINATEISDLVHNSSTSCFELLQHNFEGISALHLNLLRKMSRRDDSINLYETKRAGNTLLKLGGKMMFHPLGLYFINFSFSCNHDLNLKPI